ncbi:MAG: hypothetical protein JXR59_04065 [Desulfuromonadaceae bacterium]|nr:hypothetical protein [Desulfuromonadaceae bacterium]
MWGATPQRLHGSQNSILPLLRRNLPLLTGRDINTTQPQLSHLHERHGLDAVPGEPGSVGRQALNRPSHFFVSFHFNFQTGHKLSAAKDCFKNFNISFFAAVVLFASGIKEGSDKEKSG